MAMATQAAAGVSRKRLLESRVKLGSKTKTTFWIVLGTMATILSVAAAAAIQMRRDHLIALEQVEHDSQSFVLVSGGVVEAALEHARETLLSAISISPGTKTIAADPAVINVVAVNREGAVYWDRNGIPAEPLHVGDTDLLQLLSHAPDGTPFISGRFEDRNYGKSDLALAIKSPQLADQTYIALIDTKYLSRTLASLQGSRPVFLP